VNLGAFGDRGVLTFVLFLINGSQGDLVEGASFSFVLKGSHIFYLMFLKMVSSRSSYLS